MKVKQNSNLFVLVILTFIAIILAFSYFLYTYYPKKITAKHFVDAFGKDIRFGHPVISTNNSILRVSGQMVGIGSDSQGDYINVLFESDLNKVVSQKIRISGDIGENNVLIYKQSSYDFDPVGNISYEKTSMSEAKKTLASYNGPISFSVYLTKESLSKIPTISNNLIDDVVSCNDLFLDNLTNGSISTTCRPLTLQLNIVNE